jgi:hypothetical protein
MARPTKQSRRIHFAELRSDWYAGADFMARALQRALRDSAPKDTFVGFPRQWIPVFEWAGAPWEGSIEPDIYVPFISGMDELAVALECVRARSVGQARLLAEVIASSEVIVAETLQRVDALQQVTPTSYVPDGSRITLTNWHSYSRPELREYEEALGKWRQHRENAVFLPCGRTRPYTKSRTHYRLRERLVLEGVTMEEHDVIVMTSIGPVPESLWSHDVVMRYDTGIRDIYRILVLLRRMLSRCHYSVGWDCLAFRPYRDVLAITCREG